MFALKLVYIVTFYFIVLCLMEEGQDYKGIIFNFHIYFLLHLDLSPLSIDLWVN